MARRYVAHHIGEVMRMGKQPRGEQKPTTPANSSQQPQEVKEVPLGLNKPGNQKKR